MILRLKYHSSNNVLKIKGSLIEIMEIPKRYRFNPETGETYSIHYHWVSTEGSKSDVIQRLISEFNRMNILYEENISDLVFQIQSIAQLGTNQDEIKALQYIARRAEDELKRLRSAKSKTAKMDILRDVVRDLKIDLEMHHYQHYNND